MKIGRRGGKYGVAHKTLRKRYAEVVAAGRATCARCGLPIDPLERWDLGHTDDGRSWTGPEHMRCNRSHGGKLRAEQLYGKTATGKTKGDRFDGLPDPDPGNSVDRWSEHFAGPFNPRCPECRRLRGPCPDAEREVA